MADEQVVDPVEPEVPEVPADEPHPLEPGGKRFDAVYHDMKEARRAAETAAAETARLRAELEAEKAAKAKPAPQFYTAQQLEQMVLAGQISQGQMADQLAWQRTEQAKVQLKQEFAQQAKLDSAKGEIQQYLTKIPALKSNISPEFQKVTEAAWEIADDMGLPVSDPRVQRRALRETFGPPSRVTEIRRSREASREAADTHTETAGGQGGTPPARDPLKAVPAHIMEHWKRRGYSQEEMMAELPYVRTRRSR